MLIRKGLNEVLSLVLILCCSQTELTIVFFCLLSTNLILSIINADSQCGCTRIFSSVEKSFYLTIDKEEVILSKVNTPSLQFDSL